MNTPGQPDRLAASIKAVAVKLTDVGQTRDHNEDSVLISIPTDPAILRVKGALYIVADGMGGYQAGEIASQKAVEVIEREYYADPNEDVAGSLSRAVQKANLAVFTDAQENPKCHGMGTTTVAAVARGAEVHMVNVGDSRGYLLREGNLIQVTHDHSWVQEQIDAGIVSRENARNLPHRNVITRALGHQPEIKVDVFSGELLPGDTLLFCSDGLSGPVHDPDIAAILQQYPPEEAVSALIQSANQQGGPDNITALVVRAVAQSTESFVAVEVAPRALPNPVKPPVASGLPRVPDPPSVSVPSGRRFPWLWVGAAVLLLLLLVGGGVLWRALNPRGAATSTPTVTLATSPTPGAGQTLAATATHSAVEVATATPDKTLKPTSTPVPATNTPTPQPTVEKTPVPDCMPVAPQPASPADAASKYAGQQDVAFRWEGGTLCRDDQTWLVTFNSTEAMCWPTRDNQGTCTMPSTLGEYQWWVQLWSGGEVVLNIKSASRSLFITAPPEVPSETPGATCQPGPMPTDPCAGNWQWDTVVCGWTCEH